MNYKIKGWETEESRSEGLSFEIDNFDNVEDAANEAESYYRNGLACVEVEDDNGNLYYHLSYDISSKKEIEKYNSGKQLKQ
jgi:hypothetical protein